MAKALCPLALFRGGYDTLEIANMLGLPESYIYNRIPKLKMIERTAEQRRAKARQRYRRQQDAMREALREIRASVAQR